MAHDTLFEYIPPPDTFQWTPSDSDALWRLRQAIKVNVLREERQRDGTYEVKAAKYVGVIRLGRRTIQILPKIDFDASNPLVSEQTATANLLRMLTYAGQLRTYEHALAPLLHQGKDLFEILIHLFATHLLEEWQRGAYRTYESVEDELPILKGKWRFNEQLRHPERKHKFAVVYDEFTADTALNRVFRFVVERLWHISRDVKNRQKLNTLRQWLSEDITLVPRLTVEEAGRIRLTRLNHRFAPLLNLARLFLDGSTLQLSAGDLTTFAFVFDMEKLFEAFIVNFIRSHHAEILPQFSPEDYELLSQSAGAQYHLASRGDGKDVFRLEPDLALRRQKGSIKPAFPFLLDTKYKLLLPGDPKRGISQSDFYQMVVYAHRYACPHVLLIYPQSFTMSKPICSRFYLKGGDGESSGAVVTVATICLRIDMGTEQGRRQLVEELKEVMHKGTQP